MLFPHFLSWPNAFSYVRILLTPVFIYLAFKGYDALALFVLITAASTDFLDGYLARRLHQETFFGQTLDPIADKILLVSSYIGFWAMGRIPTLLCLIVVGRDLVLLGMGLWVVARKIPFSMAPLFISKVNTGIQIAHIIGVILSLPLSIIHISEYLVIATTLLSGILYLFSYISWYAQHKR